MIIDKHPRYAGGYSQSSSTSNQIRVDPVKYHCNGRENNLQSCRKQTTTCSNSDVAEITCVRRNVSGMKAVCVPTNKVQLRSRVEAGITEQGVLRNTFASSPVRRTKRTKLRERNWR